MRSPLVSNRKPLCNSCLVISRLCSAGRVCERGASFENRTPEGTHRCALSRLFLPAAAAAAAASTYPISHCSSLSPCRIPPFFNARYNNATAGRCRSLVDSSDTSSPCRMARTNACAPVLREPGLLVLWYAQDTAIMMSTYPTVV